MREGTGFTIRDAGGIRPMTVELIETAWWTEQQAGVIGRVLGSVVSGAGGGLVGGLRIPLVINH